MSTQALIREEPKYEAEEAPLLLKLLAEYTAKLRQECEKYEENTENRNDFLMKEIARSLFLIILIVCGLWTAFHPLSAALSLHSEKAFQLAAPAVITVGLSFLVGIVAGYKATTNKFLRRHRSQINATAYQLERLVHRISPIAEFASVGLGVKLEMDLRLGDADAALEYAAQYTGKQNERRSTVARAEVV